MDPMGNGQWRHFPSEELLFRQVYMTKKNTVFEKDYKKKVPFWMMKLLLNRKAAQDTPTFQDVVVGGWGWLP